MSRLLFADTLEERLMINLNRTAHVVLTVSQFEVAKDFYSRLMPAMGLENVLLLRRGQDGGRYSALRA